MRVSYEWLKTMVDVPENPLDLEKSVLVPVLKLKRSSVGEQTRSWW